VKDYLIKDNQTGDQWVISADSPERAREVATLRRQARQGTLPKQEAPVESPTTIGAIPGFLKEAVEAPYRGEPEDLPGFFGSLGRTYSEGAKSLFDIATRPARLIPGASEYLPEKRGIAEDVLSTVGMIPPVAGMQAAGDWAAKMARSYGASPLTAGLVSQGVGFLYPSLQKWNARRAASQLAKEEEAVAKNVSGYQKGTLQSAEELRKLRAEKDVAARAAEEGFDFGDPATAKRVQQAREETRAAQRAEQAAGGKLAEAEKGELTAAEQAAGLVKNAQDEARKKIAEAEDLRTLTAYEARVAIDDLRNYPNVAAAAAEAGKQRLTQNPMSDIQFGERFKGPEYQPKGEPKQGYFRQAEEIRGKEADKLYDAARAEMKGATIPAEKLVDPIYAELESQGVAVKAMPTSAERTGLRTAEAIDPDAFGLKAEQEAFDKVTAGLDQRHIDYLRGHGSTPGTMGIPPLPKEVVELLVGETQKMGKRKLGVGGEGALEKVIREVQKRDLERGALGEKTVADAVPAEKAMILRTRLNGAIRAADRAKDFQLSGQLKRFKNIIDNALQDVKPSALEKLGEADKFYAEKYVPYFDPRNELFKIARGKAAAVVDRIISKDNPALTQKALSILTPEAQTELRGAFVQGVFESATDKFSGAFSPRNLAGAWNSYLPEVRKMVLGEDLAKEMDQLVAGMGKRMEELRGVARAKGEVARGAREAIPGVRKEAGELAPAARAEGAALKEAATARTTAAKEAEEAARLKTKEAQTAEKATFGSLEREVRGQGERRQVAAALEEAHTKAAKKLADDTIELSKQLVKDSAVKFADQPNFFRTPQGLHMMMGMSNMQVQMALGLIDLAEFAAGVGGRRYIVFAARHIGVYILAKNPQLLGYLGKYGKKAIELTNKVVNGNPLSPGYSRQAREFFTLLQTANFERMNDEQRSGQDQEGSPNSPSDRR